VPIGRFAIVGRILAHWRDDDTVIKRQLAQGKRGEKLTHGILVQFKGGGTTYGVPAYGMILALGRANCQCELCNAEQMPKNSKKMCYALATV
jgi:hypothetical protein